MTTVAAPSVPPGLRTSTVLDTWWPLAASWLLMGIEIPLMSAVVSRMPDPEVHLAAFGIVFPLALVIEAPIIMMLAASTALCTDTDAYLRLRRFTVILGGALAVLQAVIALTPAFDLIARHLMRAPEDVIAPARLGFTIMIPWTFAIADRRFHQGLLIRFGRQHLVGIGTVIRLVGTGIPLGLGLGGVLGPGIAVAATALCAGVFFEMVYTRICAGPVRRGPLAAAEPGAVLSMQRLMRFYVPLALTPLILLFSHPLGAAGIGRMPETLVSLAVWPVANGLAFMARSTGMAFNEVSVRHAGEHGGPARLRHTAWMLGVIVSAVLLAVAATPASHWWFASVMGLEPALAELAGRAIWWAVPLPLLTFLQSYDQGILVQRHRTRGITESVGVSLAAIAIVLGLGIAWGRTAGAEAAMIAMTVGAAAQVGWLRVRAKQALALDPP